MKERGHMARLSHFVILGLILLPVLAWGKSLQILRTPDKKDAGNSQTMDLLDGYLNTNPSGIGGAVLAIVDETMIASEGEDSGAFVDPGQSGNGQISTYVVREGDTLSSIAKLYNVSVNTIAWTNNISNGRIKPGDELVILPISGVRHVVKSGDTIATIAKKYNADQGDILAYNRLGTNPKLVVGQEIIVPDGEMSSVAGASSATTKIVSGLKEAVGYFLRPIVGGRKSQGIHGHNAVDLAAPIGTPIMAAADGKVIVSASSGYNGGYGIYVVISHPNGTQTVYGHMSTNFVKVGQNVSQGDVIGRIGMTGNTSGPHVHFEVRGAKNPF
ncbi:M23 family metallopeptidase [Candidatus Parcubacteria bacterium]|nr:M23 family metallopeptidase [Candidatus Parcubacteria bacterium]